MIDTIFDCIIAVLTTIKRVVLTYICVIGMLLMGYFVFIVMLFPLWFLLEAGLNTTMPFHTIDNRLYVPLKEAAIIAIVITVVLMIKTDWID